MKRQTTDLKQQQAKIYHFNLLIQRLCFFLLPAGAVNTKKIQSLFQNHTTMIIIFEFLTMEGHKYPCSFSGKNIPEAKKELKKRYPDLQIEFICFRIIEEWECLIGLA